VKYKIYVIVVSIRMTGQKSKLSRRRNRLKFTVRLYFDNRPKVDIITPAKPAAVVCISPAGLESKALSERYNFHRKKIFSVIYFYLDIFTYCFNMLLIIYEI